jgi:hypothetical protein
MRATCDARCMVGDIGTIALGILVAAIGFVVVIAVCVVLLRLIAVVLPGGRDEPPDAEDRPAAPDGEDA